MENFQRLASGLNVKPLLEAISRQPDLWNELKARQLTPGSPHHDTETIFLSWSKEQTIEACFNDIITVPYPASEYLPEARNLVDQLLDLVKAKELGRVIITKLLPGGSIDAHTDEGAYADYFERFHICLDSEPGNLFFCGEDDLGEYAYMRGGEAWWFNHKARHWFINASPVPRLHLIIDAVAPLFRRERHAV